MSTKPHFTVHEHNEEWVLRVHHPNGSYAGIGALNSDEEAYRVCKTLNEAVKSDDMEASRWIDYFETGAAAECADGGAND